MTIRPNQGLWKKFAQHSVSMVLPLLLPKPTSPLVVCLILGQYNLFLQSTAFSRFDPSLFLTISWFARDYYGRKDVRLVLHGLVLLPFRCQLLKTWQRS